MHSKSKHVLISCWCHEAPFASIFLQGEDEEEWDDEPYGEETAETGEWEDDTAQE